MSGAAIRLGLDVCSASLSIDLIPVPAGHFLMGCDTGRDEERPVHRVWVDEFLLGVFPVRNRDYEPFLAATGHPSPPFGIMRISIILISPSLR